MPRSRVAVVPAEPEVVAQAVRTAIDRVNGLDALRGIPHVLIKPNLGWDLPFPGAVTSGWVIAAVVQAMVEAGKTVTIVEADQVLVDIARAARQAGVFHLTDHPSVRWRNLSHEPSVQVSVPGAISGVPIRLPRIVTEHPLVTIPVMKTHAKTTISGAVKNHWGLLPIDRYRLHPMLTTVLTDLIRAAPPALAVMDATIALEGNGPKSGRPRRVDHVLASTDVLALDSVAAQVMGVDPTEVAHLQALAEVRGAPVDPAVLGALPQLEPFDRADHNLVSRVEERLNADKSHPLFSSPSVFSMMCLGARAWYHAWYHWGPGIRLRDRALRAGGSSSAQSS